ncbi:MAG: quinone-dependent dihydroorotate dehydrogenase [Proteobacteria bacterium]|nr:quinone-dependent dihydroorotate dehydrogenase [Pseudomonadota bacterium]
MYKLIRPLLFRMDAERSHDLAINSLRLVSQSNLALNTLGKLYANQIKSKPLKLMGLKLSHPLGLAAGLDKQGIAGDALSALGFSFIEYGTVTPLPQPGNPKPRLFRLPEHRAIINRMGFNSIGLDAFLANIQNSRKDHIKGLNIGKNANTPIENAIEDYVTGLQAVYDIADYICINISSPNTKNLRDLQGDEQLDALLAALSQTRKILAEQRGYYKPMALKVAPDMQAQQIDIICKLLLEHKIDGLVATNTTLARGAISGHPLATEAGGLSGRPVEEQSTWCVNQFSQRLQGEIPIIGVGGIEDAPGAQAKLEAGASAIQLYSSLIFQGPGIVKKIVNNL